jgi:hypothetical protein
MYAFGVHEVGKEKDGNTQIFDKVYLLESLFFPFSDAVFNLYGDKKYQTTKITFNRLSTKNIEAIRSEEGKPD